MALIAYISYDRVDLIKQNLCGGPNIRSECVRISPDTNPEFQDLLC